jgi:hypothetical protein
MGARERLNAAYAAGAAVFAAFIGAGFKSWTVFAVVLVLALLLLCLLGGHIRVAGRRG